MAAKYKRTTQPQFIDPRNPPSLAYSRMRHYLDARIGLRKWEEFLENSREQAAERLLEHAIPAKRHAPSPFDAALLRRLAAVRDHTEGGWTDEHTETLEVIQDRKFFQTASQPQSLDELRNLLRMHGDIDKLIAAWHAAIANAVNQLESLENTRDRRLADQYVGLQKRRLEEAARDARLLATVRENGAELVGGKERRVDFEAREIAYQAQSRLLKDSMSEGDKAERRLQQEIRSTESLAVWRAKTCGARHEFPELFRDKPGQQQQQQQGDEIDLSYTLRRQEGVFDLNPKYTFSWSPAEQKVIARRPVVRLQLSELDEAILESVREFLPEIGTYRGETTDRSAEEYTAGAESELGHQPNFDVSDAVRGLMLFSGLRIHGNSIGFYTKDEWEAEDKAAFDKVAKEWADWKARWREAEQDTQASAEMRASAAGHPHGVATQNGIILKGWPSRKRFLPNRDGPYLRVPLNARAAGYVWAGWNWWKDEAVNLLIAGRDGDSQRSALQALASVRRKLDNMAQIKLPITRTRYGQISVLKAVFIEDLSLEMVATTLGYKHARQRDRVAAVRHAIVRELSQIRAGILRNASC